MFDYYWTDLGPMPPLQPVTVAGGGHMLIRPGHMPTPEHGDSQSSQHRGPRVVGDGQAGGKSQHITRGGVGGEQSQASRLPLLQLTWVLNPSSLPPKLGFLFFLK